MLDLLVDRLKRFNPITTFSTSNHLVLETSLVVSYHMKGCCTEQETAYQSKLG